MSESPRVMCHALIVGHRQLFFASLEAADDHRHRHPLNGSVGVLKATVCPKSCVSGGETQVTMECRVGRQNWVQGHCLPLAALTNFDVA